VQYDGIVIHHSVCPSINGKGFDYWIVKSGEVIPAPLETDAKYIHICLEGDFSIPNSVQPIESKEQLFALKKLQYYLAERFSFDAGNIYAHNSECPGHFFPWPELVISTKDRYH